jgi:lipoyl(octanoyl) transferase
LTRRVLAAQAGRYDVGMSAVSAPLPAVSSSACSSDDDGPLVRLLGRVPFEETFARMKAFTAARGPDTRDEVWLVEHGPVFTQGLAGKAEHLLAPGSIPVVQTNRGGQVTFHGPGQVVGYVLVDLRRQGIYIKEFVYRLEEAVLRTLADFGVTGHRVAGAPGIYVRLDDPFGHAARTGPQPAGESFRGLGKIAALGIKVSNHCTYHGLSLNVAMDLRPFVAINPCGYAGLQTVDLATLGVDAEWGDVATRVSRRLVALFTAPAPQAAPFDAADPATPA